MKFRSFITIGLALWLSSCAHKAPQPNSSTIVSMQIIDRNGFAETLSTKDRLAKYQSTDFLEPQPYQKVMRVFGKDPIGKSTSKITNYHPNGHIWQYLEVVDGRAHGLYQEWFLNGQLKLHLNVIEGVADVTDLAQNTWVFEGKNCVWDESGHLIAEICYEKGMLHGISTYYYPSGLIQRKVPYFQDMLDGEEVSYAENGFEEETIRYEKGLKHGNARRFWNPNQPMYEEIYDQGLLKEGSYFDQNGSLASSIKEGCGIQTTFKDGKLERHVEYQNGIAEGKVEIFDINGFLKTAYSQREGKKQGEEWEYYAQTRSPPQPKICYSWQDDVLQGPVKTWYANGIQESQKEMYQNKRNGLAFAWYKNGAVMLMEEYEQDVLVSGTYYKKGDKKPVSKIERGKGIATIFDADGYFLKKISYEKGSPTLEYESAK